MEGYFIRALKGKKCHFVLTKTFGKKTGCKLFREKVTFYSAGECDGEKVCFPPFLHGEKNCRGGRAAYLPKRLPVTSQFSLVLWYFTKPLFLGVKRNGCLVFLSLGRMDPRRCKEVFLPLLWKHPLRPSKEDNCLTWSTSAQPFLSGEHWLPSSWFTPFALG